MKFLTKKQFPVMGAIVVLLVTVLLIFSGSYTGTPHTREYESKYYTFSYPNEISIQASEGTKDIDFYQGEKIGGVRYCPLSNWDDLCSHLSWRDMDTKTLLCQQGILSASEDLEAYMLDTGASNRTASLWERSSDIGRYHSLFFTESGQCYDLWFYCNVQNDPHVFETANIIIDSFQMEELK